MARVCELTGVGPFTGNNVSHSNIKTRTRWLPNLCRKKYSVVELGQEMTLVLTARAIKTIDKVGGLTPALFKAKDEKLSERLQQVKRKIASQRRKASAPKKA